MDALSEVITFLRPKAFITGHTEGYSPWAIEFKGYDYVKFGFIVEGQCLLNAKGMKDIVLEQGDAWILIKPLNFILSTDLETTPLSSEDVFKAPGPRYILGKKNPKSKRTIVYGGRLDFDHLNFNFIEDNLPQIIIIKAKTASNNLKNILQILSDETQSSLMGRDAVIETLIQLIFVETLRSIDFKVLKCGSLKGLSHPDISRVINAIHKDIKKDWSVAELAKVYGASRSSFAASFKTIVGASPMEYLQKWRMVHAQNALRNQSTRISDVAYSVGYDSVTAFSTAFSKVVGQSPKSFRESLSK